MEKRKHVRDLAPFASSEDLSDERESPSNEDKQKAKLSNIEEEVMKTPPKTSLNVANVAPRIDISRASSSSHQEDSSPERELFLGKSIGPKLEIAFGEEMASDLHSSTEELSFHENEDADKNKRKKSAPMDLLPENCLRKDSACSDIALLSISGRTSRVSSIGSVASGGSAASCYSGVSHCSAVSHLSATSNLSRGSSPHRVSVETSFCGPKPVHTASLDVEDTAKSIIPDKLQQKTEVMIPSTKEAVVDEKKKTHQSRRHVSSSHNSEDTTKDCTSKSSKEHSKHKRKKPAIENPKTQKFISLHSDEEEEPIASRSVNTKTAKPSTEPTPVLDTRTQIYIPLKGSFDETVTKCEPNPNSPKRLKPFTNTTLINFIHKYDPDRIYSRTARRAKSATEADYKSKNEINPEFQTFISLKDDDDCGDGKRIKHIRSTSAINSEMRTQEKFILDCKLPERKPTLDVEDFEKEPAIEVTTVAVPIQVHQSPSPTEPTCSPYKQDLPKYLMTNDGTTQYIPLHGPDIEPEKQTRPAANQSNYLSVSKFELKSRSDDRLGPCSSASPNMDRHLMPSSLELGYRDQPSRSAKSMTQLVNIDSSRTPSPNASLHKNYSNSNSGGNHQNYLFRRCSESAKEIHRIGKPKSRSGSFRSLFNTIFKRSGSIKHKKEDKTRTPEISTSSASTDYYVKPQVKKSSEPDSIIIPLHSPDEIPSKDADVAENEVICVPAAINNNKNNSNINDEPPIIITTTVKMEYSEEQMKAEDKAQQTTNALIFKKEESINLECDTASVSDANITPTNKPESYQMQCEVTVHSEGLTRSETRTRNEKLVRTERIDSTDSSNHSQAQEPNKTDADSDRNSLIENQIEPLSLPDKTSAEDDAADVSTDSDKGAFIVAENDDEHKKLVQQEESFEELPYVPTTLPLERSAALPIVPIKERVCEVRTCSVDRPRSGTSLNSTILPVETYLTSLPSTKMATELSSSTEKLHITLPRTDAPPNSPKKKLSLTKSKTTAYVSTQRHHSISAFTSNNNRSPPPLPPRKSSMSWISFDDTGHEMRQSPKRITTLPSSYAVEGNYSAGRYPNTSSNQKVVPVFVNSDECSCECHENQNTSKESHHH